MKCKNCNKPSKGAFCDNNDKCKEEYWAKNPMPPLKHGKSIEEIQAGIKRLKQKTIEEEETAKFAEKVFSNGIE